MKLKEAITELKNQRLSIEKILDCTERTLKEKVGGYIYDNSKIEIMNGVSRLYDDVIRKTEKADEELQEHIAEYKKFFKGNDPLNCHIEFDLKDKSNEDQLVRIINKEFKVLVYSFYSGDYPMIGEFLEELCVGKKKWEDFIEYLN